jgi:hypothetical protein
MKRVVTDVYNLAGRQNIKYLHKLLMQNGKRTSFDDGKTLSEKCFCEHDEDDEMKEEENVK